MAIAIRSHARLTGSAVGAFSGILAFALMAVTVMIKSLVFSLLY